MVRGEDRADIYEDSVIKEHGRTVARVAQAHVGEGGFARMAIQLPRGLLAFLLTAYVFLGHTVTR